MAAISETIQVIPQLMTADKLSEELSTELIIKLQELGFRVSGPVCKVLCSACDKVAKEVLNK